MTTIPRVITLNPTLWELRYWHASSCSEVSQLLYNLFYFKTDSLVSRNRSESYISPQK